MLFLLAFWGENGAVDSKSALLLLIFESRLVSGFRFVESNLKPRIERKQGNKQS